ncbi:glycogen debranching enzyme, partial [Microbacterium sp. zg.Y909]|nr:glycogen debranching enzyme [Microbacterium sp. zg.Y909]
GIRERDRRGEPIRDQHFLVLFNAGDEAVDFFIPDPEFAPHWDVMVDTAGELADSAPIDPGATVQVQGKALVVLREHSGPEQEVDHSVAASLATNTGVIDEVPAASPKGEAGR